MLTSGLAKMSKPPRSSAANAWWFSALRLKVVTCEEPAALVPSLPPRAAPRASAPPTVSKR